MSVLTRHDVKRKFLLDRASRFLSIVFLKTFHCQTKKNSLVLKVNIATTKRRVSTEKKADEQPSQLKLPVLVIVFCCLVGCGVAKCRRIKKKFGSIK